MTAADATSAAADLAEQILDAVSSRDQNWRRVAAMARELAELADRTGRLYRQAPRPEENPMTLPDDPSDLDGVAAAFRALGHPTRLRILDTIGVDDEMSPTQLIDRIGGDAGLANVAYHTRELASLGLLAPAGSRPARGALEHFYRLSPSGRALIELARQVPT